MNRYLLPLACPLPLAFLCGFLGILFLSGAAAQENGPDRKLTVYLLPHSHVDIGYTKLQAEVERDHWRFYEMAIEASAKTADNPPDSRFKWNVEVLWALDSYLKQAAPEKKRQLIEAVKRGVIGLDALYCNELTGLCRPEELVRLIDFARRISKRHGVKIDSAMISDVPGITWGLTSVLADSGVRYLSMGPNVHARFGRTFEAWADRPFYWRTPCGRHKILCWVHGKGYWNIFHDTDELMDVIRQLHETGYPYDVVAIRYCLGDNSGPGLVLADMVKKWNAQHDNPRLIIATTSEAFEAFERRHGDRLPEVRGDFTPYWEDGAASSARETGVNRTAAERLCQAETLWAISDPKGYPADRFYDAWRNVLLYNEHTWGAAGSVSNPDGQATRQQWAIKQAFALDADRQSRALLDEALKPWTAPSPAATAVLVFNTLSWPRTDLVVLPKESAPSGDCVKGPDSRTVPSQRLADGFLAFMATDVPAFGAKRFTFSPDKAMVTGNAGAAGQKLQNSLLSLTVDPRTGAVTELTAKGINGNLVDASAGPGVNGYFYVPGNNNQDVQPGGPATIAVKQRGPLVASLLVEGEAPGCRRLTREIRVVDGLPRVEIINVIDKQKIRTKEGVHVGFALNVPGGAMRMDVPWAVARPEVDQLPGANKNYFSVGRWIDVSNSDFGVSWATVDAPLVEVGAITAPTTGELPDISAWLESIAPSGTFYSYVMNNYWFTNYKADQEGPTTFRYALHPHQGTYDSVEAARFGIQQSQPLVVVPATGPRGAILASRLCVGPREVIVAAFKPSGDGKAWIVRLFGAGPKATKATLTWGDPAPKAVWLSNLAEDQGARITGPVDVPAHGIVTLRADLPQ